jgi:benzoyl-CoA 2,3-dioxygenase component A
MEALLAEAHKGAGGKARAPATASKPAVNLYNLGKPAVAKVQGNFRLTSDKSGSDVRHIILDFGGQHFPVLEGQSIGIIPPGTDANGKPHLPRLYSVSSPRDGERRNYNNLSLTVKRDDKGVCSNYVCDLKIGDEVQVTGPFGATFLMPDDPSARMLMICTGTGSAPFRAFTMRRQRAAAGTSGDMVMFFGARTPDSLPYFGPLAKIPDRLLKKHLVFSRIPGVEKEYVQDRMMVEEEVIADLLADPKTHIYICGLKGMEQGVEHAFKNIAESTGMPWEATRDVMREEGRYHVETY